MPWTGGRLGLDEIGDHNWGTRMAAEWSHSLVGERRAINEVAGDIEWAVNVAINEDHDEPEAQAEIDRLVGRAQGVAYGWCISRCVEGCCCEDGDCYEECEREALAARGCPEPVWDCHARIRFKAMRLARLRIARRNRIDDSWNRYHDPEVQGWITDALSRFGVQLTTWMFIKRMAEEQA